MLNRYPLWVNLIVVFAVLIAVIYSLPNLYPDDFAVQITRTQAGEDVSEAVLERVETSLQEAGIDYFQPELVDGNALIRFADGETQLAAKDRLQNVLGDDYLAALNLAPTTPEWLVSLGAQPMKLGLDLRGGVHFLLEVDTDYVLQQRLDGFLSEIKTKLREERIRYRDPTITESAQIQLRFRDASTRDEALSFLRGEYFDFQYTEREQGGEFLLELALLPTRIQEIEDSTIKQNLVTLRNRVNELGVAEPLVQRQGPNRIVVELPGVQDTAGAKKIIGKTANLEFRLEARPDASRTAVQTYEFRSEEGRFADLQRDIIVTGSNVSNAAQNFDENGLPEVNITLDSKGGKLMYNVTKNAVKRRMAVLFVEQKEVTRTDSQGFALLDDAGQAVKDRITEKSIISLAVIQSPLGNRFRITGLDSLSEASELALLLRAGALAAPVYFVEERTIGPSLGEKNIAAGVLSVQIGALLVLLFMLVYYRLFGVVANIALTINLMLLLAFMSILSATLTLPGIAGIVLTVGMAVDANVLIFSRIREELKNGLPVQSAIHAGYDRAFVAILDANLTTLLVAVILFAVGTGPVKGFAVTLSIGILTSMFTAIVLTRSLVNLIYGGRNVTKLAI